MISHKDETVVRILSNAITRLDDYIMIQHGQSIVMVMKERL